MKNLLISVAACLALVGCSSAGDYYRSVEASNAHNVALAKAHAEAETVRYGALMKIAQSGDATAQVAAAMALAMSGQGGRVSQAAVAQPQPSEALQWASVLVPGVTQGLSIYYNTRASMAANDNATTLGINTNATFGKFASEINSPTIVRPEVVVTPAPDTVVVNPVIVTPEIVRPEVVTQQIAGE